MSRVDQWEIVAAIAIRACKPRTVRGVRYSLNAYRVASQLDRLARIARTLTRYNTFACNQDTAPHSCLACGGELARGHSFTNCFYGKVEGLEKRAELIGKELGLVVTTQRDPRGQSVKVWADKEDGQQLGGFS
jgi:hypothetical protein